MPTFELTGPDGKKYQVDGPDAQGAVQALKKALAGGTQPMAASPSQPPANAKPAYSGGILPFSRDAEGNVGFDSNAGIVGMAKRAFMLPGEVMAGKVDPLSEEGIDRAAEMGTMVAPISPAMGTGKAIAAAHGGNRRVPLPPGQPPPRMPAGAMPGVDMAERQGLAQEFNMPISRGQATGNINQQAREQAMRAGTYGQGAQNTAMDFGRQQATATDEAISGVQRGLAGPNPPTGAISEGGEAAISGVRGRVQQLEGIGNQQFEAARAANMSVLDTSVLNAPSTIRQAVSTADVRVNPALHPSANAALEEIDNLAHSVGADRSVSFAKIDETRRILTRMQPKDREDARALGEVKKAFSQWMEDSVDNALFAGDPAGVKELKKGIATWRTLRAITDPRHGDDAGAVIAKMANRDISGQEAANWLHGASALGGNGAAYRVAKRLKGIVGADSQEWAAIRQSYWLALTRGGAKATDQASDAAAGDPMAMVRGSQAMANQIQDFVSGRGRFLAETLFSPEELTKMGRFAKLQRMMTPDRMSTNQSGSGYAAMRPLAKLSRGLYYTIMGGLGAMAGGSAGGPMGATAGAAAGIGTAKVFAGVRGSMLANKAFASAKRTVPMPTGSPARPGPGATMLPRVAVPALLNPEQN